MSTCAERRWTSRDGLSLFARDYCGASGEARLPVICLHGLTRNSRDFEEIAPRLAATGRRLLVPDIRGRGRSDRDPNPFNYVPKVYARDVLELMHTLGVGQAVFLGTSMGGIVAMTIAAMHPKAVASAIFNDVGPEFAPEGVARIMGYAGKPAEIHSWGDAADYARRTNAAAFPAYGEEDWRNFAARTFRDEAGRPALDYDSQILAPLTRHRPSRPNFLSWFLFRRFARKRPILLVRGAISDLVTPQIADRMQRQVPALRRVDVPGVGHAPMLTEPVAVDAIEQFLRTVP